MFPFHYNHKRLVSICQSRCAYRRPGFAFREQLIVSFSLLTIDLALNRTPVSPFAYKVLRLVALEPDSDILECDLEDGQDGSRAQSPQLRCEKSLTVLHHQPGEKPTSRTGQVAGRANGREREKSG